MLRPLLKKIQSPQALQIKLARAKRKTVFTNGCFDLLHKGHVTYLESARKLGDLLIVALDTDASVRKLKGAGRPINRLTDRMEVIAALESVDYVTWFTGSDPRPLIRKLRPRVLVKGGDWKPDQILGSREVLSWGGQVASISYVKGRSTTKMLARARKRR